MVTAGRVWKSKDFEKRVKKKGEERTGSWFGRDNDVSASNIGDSRSGTTSE